MSKLTPLDDIHGYFSRKAIQVQDTDEFNKIQEYIKKLYLIHEYINDTEKERDFWRTHYKHLKERLEILEPKESDDEIE